MSGFTWPDQVLAMEQWHERHHHFPFPRNRSSFHVHPEDGLERTISFHMDGGRPSFHAERHSFAERRLSTMRRGSRTSEMRALRDNLRREHEGAHTDDAITDSDREDEDNEEEEDEEEISPTDSGKKEQHEEPAADFPLARYEVYQDPRFFYNEAWKEYIFILCTFVGQVMTQASTNCTYATLKIFESFYGATSAQRSWFMSAFALTCGTFIIISGRMGDVYGTRKMIIVGYAFTLLWMVLGGVSFWVSSPVFFIVCRAFQGLGTSFILPNIIGAVGRVYTPGCFKKHVIFSMIGWASPIGGWSGVFFSGIIATETYYWNWIMWALAILCLIGLVTAYLSCPLFEDYEEEHTRSDQDVDAVGSVLAVVSLVLFSFVWNQAPGAENRWANPYIIVLLIVSLIVFGLFLHWELHFAKYPLLPRSVLSNPRLLLTMASLFFSWGSYGIMMYHFNVFLLYERGYNAIKTGAAIAPCVIAGGIAALSTSYLIRLTPIEILMMVAMLFFVASDILLATLKVDAPFWGQSITVFVLAAIGQDFSFPAGSILLSDELPYHLQGMAGSILMTAINYGIAFFVGVSATVDDEVQRKVGGTDQLQSIRAAMYFCIGVSGSSVVTAGLAGYLRHRKIKQEERELESADVTGDYEKGITRDDKKDEMGITSDDKKDEKEFDNGNEMRHEKDDTNVARDNNEHA